MRNVTMSYDKKTGRATVSFNASADAVAAATPAKKRGSNNNIVATTEGFVAIPGCDQDVRLNLNVLTPRA